jgi:hypothetical protein
MNLERIINMVIRQVVNTLTRQGINAASGQIKKIGQKKKAPMSETMPDQDQRREDR